jgi:hypothetical protein
VDARSSTAFVLNRLSKPVTRDGANGKTKTGDNHERLSLITVINSTRDQDNIRKGMHTGELPLSQ